MGHSARLLAMGTQFLNLVKHTGYYGYCEEPG
jgi:hypothetical protein